MAYALILDKARKGLPGTNTLAYLSRLSDEEKSLILMQPYKPIFKNFFLHC
jgi:hypothetical protein